MKIVFKSALAILEELLSNVRYKDSIDYIELTHSEHREICMALDVQDFTSFKGHEVRVVPI